MAEQAELSVREVARRLGFHLATVYQLIWSTKLPATRREGRWFVPVAAVEARLRARRRRTRRAKRV